MIHKTFENFICYISGEKLRQWDYTLAHVGFVYNFIVNHLANQSPFSIVYYFPSKISLDLLQLPQQCRMSITTNNMTDNIKAIKKNISMNYEKYKAAINQRMRRRYLKLKILLWFIYKKNDFWLVLRTNWSQKNMDHPECCNESMIMLTSLSFLLIRVFQTHSICVVFLWVL